MTHSELSHVRDILAKIQDTRYKIQQLRKSSRIFTLVARLNMYIFNPFLVFSFFVFCLLNQPQKTSSATSSSPKLSFSNYSVSFMTFTIFCTVVFLAYRETFLCDVINMKNPKHSF